MGEKSRAESGELGGRVGRWVAILSRLVEMKTSLRRWLSPCSLENTA